jgi:hypothetical protein
MYSECVSSLWYPAINAHAPYCDLRSGMLYSIFPHYLKTAQFSEKQNSLNIKKVFWFYVQVCPKYFSF